MNVIAIVSFFPEGSFKKAGNPKVEGEGNLTSQKRESFTTFCCLSPSNPMDQPTLALLKVDSPEPKLQGKMALSFE